MPRRRPEPDLDPVAPLRAARLRLQNAERPPTPTPPPPPPKPEPTVAIPRPNGRPKKFLTPDLVVGMRAAGVPSMRIAEAMGVSPKVVKNTLAADPTARDRIALLREKLKDLKMQRAHQVEGKLWTRFEEEIDKGDAKSVDAIARSLLASEKIQAAASGEAHASGPSSAPPPTTTDLAQLIQILITAH